MSLGRLSPEGSADAAKEYVPEALREKTAKFERFLCALTTSPLTHAGRKPSIAVASPLNALTARATGVDIDKNGISRGEWTLDLPNGIVRIHNITDGARLSKNTANGHYSWHFEIAFKNSEKFTDLPFKVRRLVVSLIQDGKFPTGLDYKLYGAGQWDDDSHTEEEHDEAIPVWDGEYAAMHYLSTPTNIVPDDVKRLNMILDYIEKVIEPAVRREQGEALKQQDQLARLSPDTIHQVLASLVHEGGPALRAKINEILHRPTE